MRQTIFLTVFLSGLILSVPATAGNPQRGLDLSEIKGCQTCHGVDGNTTVDDTTPRLAGQHVDYLVRALQDYRSGQRDNAIMAGFAGDLSDRDIRDLAAWYANQKGLTELRIR